MMESFGRNWRTVGLSISPGGSNGLANDVSVATAVFYSTADRLNCAKRGMNCIFRGPNRADAAGRVRAAL
jgi:hypothetical protein